VDKQEGENIRRYSQNDINDEFLNQNFKANVDICEIAEKPSPQHTLKVQKMAMNAVITSAGMI
jgi:hypothetical protein